MEKIVKQRVFFIGENSKIKQLQKNIQNKKEHRCFDFNAVVPMPPEVYSGPLNSETLAECGENNWYDWCKQHWGTMNNACDASICGNMLELSTIYGVPRPVYAALSSQYPDVQIKVVYASKDRSAIGIELYERGEFMKMNSVDLSDDELWSGLWGCDGGMTNATSA